MYARISTHANTNDPYKSDSFDSYADVMARYRSSPAVSQIWALTVKPPSSTVRVLNSTPMVVRLSWLNSFLVKRDRRLLFPTPDSPIRTTEEKTQQNVKEFCISWLIWFSCKTTNQSFLDKGVSQKLICKSCDVHVIHFSPFKIQAFSLGVDTPEIHSLSCQGLVTTSGIQCPILKTAPHLHGKSDLCFNSSKQSNRVRTQIGTTESWGSSKAYWERCMLYWWGMKVVRKQMQD